MAGYSKTPLPQKLGIKAEHVVCLLNAPEGLAQTLTPLPAGVSLFENLRGTGRKNVIVFFTTGGSELEKAFDRLKKRLAYDGGLWICWPKNTSGVETDLNENRVREIALASGLVDNKVCAVDDTWSGLRLVYRLKDRPV